MATNTHKPIAWSALASILLALAIGMTPIATFLTLEQTLSSVAVAQ